MSFLLGNWKLMGLAALGLVIGGMYIRMEFAVHAKERAEILLTQIENDLAFSEQQNAALAQRFVEEVQAHHQAQERERQVSNQRRSEAIAARTEHERIAQEIMDSLEHEACSVVAVPAGSLNGLREYTDFANGLRGDPGQPLPAGALSID